MEFDSDRLRTPEWVLGIVALLLLLDLFVLPWYGLTETYASTAQSLGQPTTATGWEGLLVLGPIVLLAAVGGFVGLLCQAGSRGPALPVAVISLTEGLTFLALIGLLVRVVLLPPSVFIQGTGGVDAIVTKPGGYIGLVLTVVQLGACWRSLRQSGGTSVDPAPEVEVLRLARR